MQLGVCKRTQHVTSYNVGSCWPTCCDRLHGALSTSLSRHSHNSQRIPWMKQTPLQTKIRDNREDKHGLAMFSSCKIPLANSLRSRINTAAGRKDLWNASVVRKHFKVISVSLKTWRSSLTTFWCWFGHLRAVSSKECINFRDRKSHFSTTASAITMWFNAMVFRWLWWSICKFYLITNQRRPRNGVIRSKNMADNRKSFAPSMGEVHSTGSIPSSTFHWHLLN